MTRFLIGFTEKFYTLWEKTESPMLNGSGTHIGTKTHFHYLQNLSFDEDGAKKRFTEITKLPAPEPDMELRGITLSFVVEKMNPDVFPKGKYIGHFLTECDDIPYLSWAFNNILRPESKKLVEPILLKHRYTINENGKSYPFVEQTKEEVLLENCNKDICYVNGEKIELSVTVVNMFSFDGNFGRCTVCEMVDENNNLVKYVGSSPSPDMWVGSEFRLKGTVKHDKFRNQTNLIRIKVLEILNKELVEI